MAEFLKSVVKAARRVVILGLAVSILVKCYSVTNAAGFDPLWYAEQNPDVVAELGDSPEMLELHYELLGKTECRMSNSTDVEAKLRKLFNAEEYAVLYPDVVEAFGNDPEILFEHYVAYGILESRKASEKMSPATVASLKEAVTNAMESIGAEAVPGSIAVIAVMEGAVTEDAAVQDALAQIQDSLVEAVETTIVEANKPEPVEEDSDDDDDEESSSSSSSSSGSSYVDPCKDGHTWVAEEGYHTCSVCGSGDLHGPFSSVNSSVHKCDVCGYQQEHYPSAEDGTKCDGCGATISSQGQTTPSTPDTNDENQNEDNN